MSLTRLATQFDDPRRRTELATPTCCCCCCCLITTTAAICLTSTHIGARASAEEVDNTTIRYGRYFTAILGILLLVLWPVFAILLHINEPDALLIIHGVVTLTSIALLASARGKASRSSSNILWAILVVGGITLGYAAEVALGLSVGFASLSVLIVMEVVVPLVLIIVAITRGIRAR